jgi:hypothetical protein
MDAERLEQDLYEADGLSPDSASSAVLEVTTSEVHSEVLYSLDKVSELLTKFLGTEVQLTTENYYDVMTAERRMQVAKKMKNEQFGLALRYLPTLARHDMDHASMAAALGLSAGSVGGYRHHLIRAGVCRRKGFTDEELKRMFEDGYQVPPDILVKRFGSIDDARERFGIKPERRCLGIDRMTQIIRSLLAEGGPVYQKDLHKSIDLTDSEVWTYAKKMGDLGILGSFLKSGKRAYYLTDDAAKAIQILEGLDFDLDAWNVMRYCSLPLKAIFALRLNKSEKMSEAELSRKLGADPESEGLLENPIFVEHVSVSFNASENQRYFRLSDSTVAAIDGFFGGDQKRFSNDSAPRLDDVLLGPRAHKQRRVVGRYETVEGRRLPLQKIIEILYLPRIMNFNLGAYAIDENLFGGRGFVTPRDFLDWSVYYGIDPRLEDVVKGRCEDVVGVNAVPYIVRDFISLLSEHRNEKGIDECSRRLLFHPAYVSSLAGAFHGNGYAEYATKLLEQYFTYERYAEYLAEFNVRVKSVFSRSCNK